MKYSIILIVLLMVAPLQARQFIIDIPDRDLGIVENDIVNADVWLREVWNNKLKNCRARLIKEEVDLSVKNNEPIPAGEDAIIDKHFMRPGYESRKVRDAKERQLR